MIRIKTPMGGMVLAAAVLLLLAPPAVARVQDGLDLVLEPVEAPAKAGQLFTARLRILSDRPLQLTDFTIEGDQWSNLTWTEIRGASLSPEAPVTVEFSGKPGRADAPLTIMARSENKAFRRTFTLGGEDFERRRQVLPTRLADNPGPGPWIGQWALATPVQPAEPRLDPNIDYSADDREGPEPTDKTAKDRTIRIRGRFIYVRDGANIIGADGMSVHVYDDDPFFDDHLGSSVTDANGEFDFTIYWESQPTDTHPDLLLELVTENTEIKVRPVGATNPYHFEYGPWNDFSGDELDMQVGLPLNEEDQPIGHLITNYTRFWRYLHGHGHDTRFLEVRWPGDIDDGAYYQRVSETIQLSTDYNWSSGTQAHEFGHHTMNCLSEMPDIDYCNGVCDDNEPWDCSHCRWCEEDVSIAWSEGWAQYIAHVIPETFDAVYGLAAIGTRSFENLRTCSEDSLWDDPLITEGFTGAVLVDASDSNWDNAPHFPAYDDRAELGQTVILDVLDSNHPMSTTAFLMDLKQQFPDEREDLWWSAMNNGYNIDEEPPDAVYSLFCMSHSVNVPSANPDLTFYWQRPYDDAAGVRGYDVRISNSGPEDPGYNLDLEGETLKTYSGVPPGTYHFSIRSVDWDGNWSDEYTSIGPIIIIEPEPINLVFQLPEGWDYFVVPSNTEDATLTWCPLPETLDSMQPTYWNMAARNDSDLYTVADTYSAFIVDGVIKGTFNWGNLPGWCSFVVMNEGPELVVGGMHTVTGYLDPDNLVNETDESDNRIGKQFAWRPPAMDPQTLYANGLGVPIPTAGWLTVPSTWKFYNCYGMTFHSSGWWNALVMWSDYEDVDYDLRLFEVDENPIGGFMSALEVSSQPAGWVDAVLVNRNTMGSTDWDAGVLNHYLHTGSHRYQHIQSTEVAFGDSLTEIMGEDQYVMLREFFVDYADVGGVSLDLWTDPPQANVGFSWRDMDFTTGDIMEADAMVLTGADGHGHLDVDIPLYGYSCLMISRRPMDGDEDLQVSYRIRPTLPDLRPAHLAGWYSPVVPRPDEAGGLTSVNLPEELHGDLVQTWFNYAAENNSTGTALAAMRFHVMIDEGSGSFGELYLNDLEGGEVRAVNNNGPRLVTAGRHTVVLNLDRGNYMEELDESNNTYGEQYVWAPPLLHTFDKVVRNQPPDKVAGWTDIQSGGLVYYNCDGLRAAQAGGYWRAVAVMPRENSDVDLRLHEVVPGVKDGFGSNLARSSWGLGQSDYLLVNHNLTSLRPFDVGVLAVSGDEYYAAEIMAEYWLGPGATVHGPVTMGPGEIVDVYETNLPEGTWRITLTSNSGEVDWGLAFHRFDLPYLTKADVLEDGAAWYEPAGAGEEVVVDIEVETYYAFTVWKVGAADLDLTGSYSIEVAAGGPSPVDELPLPTLTRVAGVYPNPFNPQTTVEFELAAPTQVDLAVYDLTGRKVVTLVRENFPAGRHQQVWKGKDSAGHQVASGMYVVRMEAGGTTDLKKVMLLK